MKPREEHFQRPMFDIKVDLDEISLNMNRDQVTSRRGSHFTWSCLSRLVFGSARSIGISRFHECSIEIHQISSEERDRGEEEREEVMTGAT